MTLPCVTLYQPHATLMAIGAKRIETRPRKWRYRGRLWIHAGKSTEWLELCHEKPFKSVLAKAGFHRPQDLPLGAVLCSVDMYACVATDILTSRMTQPPLSAQELAFGDYGPNRFGYLCRDVQPLPEPVPARGKQGCWYWEPHGKA